MRKLHKLFFIFVLGFIPIQMFAWPGVPLSVLHFDGEYLKDPCGHTVLLQDVAMPPSPWFNRMFDREHAVVTITIFQGYLNCNNTVMDALTNTSGWYLNYIRFHIDHILDQ